MTAHLTIRFAPIAAAVLSLGALVAGCSKPSPPPARSDVFDTPEAAVRSLEEAVAKSDLARVVAIFGPEGQELVDTSDPDTARHNREVVAVAMKEGWHLDDQGDAKILVVGNEAWPFPVPLVKDGTGWRFDTAAGKEEVVARRIGRNELAVIRVCRTYVAAQRAYAAFGHDKNPKGVYAVSFRSDEGRQNGLYWPSKRGQLRSPIGALLQEAEERASQGGSTPSPFHGYYFRILTGQGASAEGGARDYVVNGRMSGGFALIAWPAYYDASGVMTFVVNQEGIVYQKDLGADTDAAARKVTVYDPDPSWARVN